MDLPAEFYLQTVASVFQDHDLPRGPDDVARATGSSRGPSAAPRC